jgi:acetyltransferase
MSSPSRSASKPRSLDALFRPRAIAVVGASRRPGSIGRQVVENLLAAGFEGPVYPVNASSPVVLSMPAFRSVLEIPGPVDCAVLVVPPADVLAVAEQCGRKGVAGLVVVTAGFREIGGEGIAREERLKAICRRWRMRVIGPNCMGVINTQPGVRLNASFAAALPPPGRVAMVSQSGALGEAILADASASGVGVAMFASIGNRVDVTAADLIAYWERDPGVAAILLYIEDFGDVAGFVAVARRVARHKPIIAVKSGRSAAGAAATGSHTGSIALPDVAADTLLSQCGVLRVESFREMFALAAALLHQPLPAGDRVAIVTNAGGPGILATDALVGGGLTIAELGAGTRRRLRRVLPAEASIQNPVDLVASADATRYRQALAAIAHDRGVDAILVLFVSPVMIDAAAVAEAIVEQTAGRKPTLACVMGRRRGNEALDILRRAGIVVFRYPEDASATLRMLVRRRRMLARRPGRTRRLPVDRRAVRAILARHRDGWLPAAASEGVLTAYGIPFARAQRVGTPAEAVAAAHALGFPVVVKAEAERLLHKSEHRAVVVGLADGDQVWDAAEDLLARLRRKFGRVRLCVQQHARGHRELMLSMTRGSRVGPLFAIGIGGTLVEVLRDVAFRVAPMDDKDPHEMLASLKGAPLLGAFRGTPPLDPRPAADALLRLQQLALDFPALAEIEVNPFIAGARGVPSVAVDARIRIEA